MTERIRSQTFDAAYAIEATCHAPVLLDAYKEIFRVVKPGRRFVTYEWVASDLYDPKNPEHVKIIDEINKGNGLPEMRTRKEAEEAARKAGFKIIQSVDMAAATSPHCTPWTARLAINRYQHFINAAIVNTLDALCLLPKGVKQAHDMLVEVAHWLVRGGETGVFCPMQLIILEKPL